VRPSLRQDQLTISSPPPSKADIPHEGKAKEEMTEKERTERALGLIKHAFSVGRQPESRSGGDDSAPKETASQS